jgi:hypothetical protein
MCGNSMSSACAAAANVRTPSRDAMNLRIVASFLSR